MHDLYFVFTDTTIESAMFTFKGVPCSKELFLWRWAIRDGTI